MEWPHWTQPYRSQAPLIPHSPEAANKARQSSKDSTSKTFIISPTTNPQKAPLTVIAAGVSHDPSHSNSTIPSGSSESSSLSSPHSSPGPKRKAGHHSRLHSRSSKKWREQRHSVSKQAAGLAHDAGWAMDAPQTKNGSISSGSAQSVRDEAAARLPAASLTGGPFEIRNGRPYFRELPYPLPNDLAELQRANLRTLLTTTLFGGPVGSPHVSDDPPKRVLEVACGSGYWSSLCHDHFAAQGDASVSFTGLDVVALAPDLQKQGVNWRFVQHDLRRPNLPFEPDSFDLVILKDLSLVVPLGQPSQRIMDEAARVLRRGGVLEIWDCDHVIRSLLPHPPPPPNKRAEDSQRAKATASFLISPTTPFATAQNKFLNDYNAWLHEALDRRKLPSAPCSLYSQVLLQETDTLCEIGCRRIAMPLGELRWEKEGNSSGRATGGSSSSGPSSRRPSMTTSAKVKAAALASPVVATHVEATESSSALNEYQIGLRVAALLTVVQMIESLEPLLKEVSGKSQEEWQHWLTSMMTGLLDHKGASSGECLEMGVWWAKKI